MSIPQNTEHRTQNTEHRTQNRIEEVTENTSIENAGRRKVIKTIVGGVATATAFQFLPAKWGSPIIESVFLPAHAATSGETEETETTSSNEESSEQETSSNVGSGSSGWD